MSAGTAFGVIWGVAAGVALGWYGILEHRRLTGQLGPRAQREVETSIARVGMGKHLAAIFVMCAICPPMALAICILTVRGDRRREWR